MKLYFTNPLTFEGTPTEIGSLIEILNMRADRMKRRQYKAASKDAEDVFDTLANALSRKINSETTETEDNDDRPE